MGRKNTMNGETGFAGSKGVRQYGKLCWRGRGLAVCVASVGQMWPAGPVAAQSVQSVSPSVASHSGRVVVRGTGFEAEAGRVLIGGVEAHIASWTDERIGLFVDSDTPIGAGSMTILTASGGSASMAMEVEPRVVARGGRVRWRFDADAIAFRTRPATASDGAIFATSTSGQLYALEADGSVRWIRMGMNGAKSPAIGQDGTVYAVGLGAMLAALNPQTGQTIWTVEYPSNADQVYAGPNVGPNGTIYVVTDENLDAGFDFGVGAISPSGAILWNTSNNFGVRISSLNFAWEIACGTSGVYVPSGMGNSLNNVLGVHALSTSGGAVQWNVLSLMQPRIGADGNIYLRNVDGNFFASYTPSGTERWRSHHMNFAGTPTGEIDLDPQSNFYTTSGINFASGTSDGQFRWNVQRSIETMQYAAASPLGGLVLNQVMPFDVQSTARVQAYDQADGSELWSEEFGFDNSIRIVQAWFGGFADDGKTYYIPASGDNSAADPIAPLFAINTSESTSSCPADFTGDGNADFFDVLAFLTVFAAQDVAADLNNDGAWDFFDIAAFLNVFSVGCP